MKTLFKKQNKTQQLSFREKLESKIRLNSAAVHFILLLPHTRLFHHFSFYSFQRSATNLEIQFLPYESESMIFRN